MTKFWQARSRTSSRLLFPAGRSPIWASTCCTRPSLGSASRTMSTMPPKNPDGCGRRRHDAAEVPLFLRHPAYGENLQFLRRFGNLQRQKTLILDGVNLIQSVELVDGETEERYQLAEKASGHFMDDEVRAACGRSDILENLVALQYDRTLDADQPRRQPDNGGFAQKSRHRLPGRCG